MWTATATQVRRTATVPWQNALTAVRRFVLTVVHGAAGSHSLRYAVITTSRLRAGSLCRMNAMFLVRTRLASSLFVPHANDYQSPSLVSSAHRVSSNSRSSNDDEPETATGHRVC